jgi:predicted RNA-binding protein YlqC (UPF0109 family)
VHDGDIGKLIGRQGYTAKSIRVIVGAIGTRNRRRYLVDIAETTSGNAATSPSI